jgi:hypothetical protein
MPRQVRCANTIPILLLSKTVSLSRLQAAQRADPNYAQPSGLGETVAPQKWCGVKENRHALAFGKRAQKEKHNGRMCDVQAKHSAG